MLYPCWLMVRLVYHWLLIVPKKINSRASINIIFSSAFISNGLAL